jgi:hypothetical protein
MRAAIAVRTIFSAAISEFLRPATFSGQGKQKHNPGVVAVLDVALAKRASVGNLPFCCFFGTCVADLDLCTTVPYWHAIGLKDHEIVTEETIADPFVSGRLINGLEGSDAYARDDGHENPHGESSIL